MSNIEWTEKTWNPTVGCSEVSRGCTNCYAAKMAYRLIAMGQKDYEGTVKKLPNKKIVWTGLVKTLEHKLLLPTTNKKPTTFFVDSMSDLFHKDVPFEFIDKAFAIMMLTPQHTYQVLTKRPTRMLEYCQSRQDFDEIQQAAEIIVMENPHLFHVCTKTSKEERSHGAPPIHISNEILDHLSTFGWFWDTTYGEFGKDTELIFEETFPPKHIWLGTSIENQKAADERGKPLFDLHNQGWMTWVSNEPAVGPVDWEDPFYFGFLDWMVTGGESGSEADPMHPEWARNTRDFCKKNKIPFFFKQNGQYRPMEEKDKFQGNNWLFVYKDGYTSKTQIVRQGEKAVAMKKASKHDNGRLLDAVLHNEYPKTRSK